MSFLNGKFPLTWLGFDPLLIYSKCVLHKQAFGALDKAKNRYINHEGLERKQPQKEPVGKTSCRLCPVTCANRKVCVHFLEWLRGANVEGPSVGL